MLTTKYLILSVNEQTKDSYVPLYDKPLFGFIVNAHKLNVRTQPA